MLDATYSYLNWQVPNQSPEEAKIGEDFGQKKKGVKAIHHKEWLANNKAKFKKVVVVKEYEESKVSQSKEQQP